MLSLMVGLVLASNPISRSGNTAIYDETSSELFVLDSERGEIAVFNQKGEEKKSLSVGTGPVRMVRSRRGTLYVTVRGEGLVVSLSSDGSKTKTELDGEPFGIALSDDQKTVFVSLATANQVVALDARTLKQKWQAPVEDRPRPVAYLPGGRVAVGYLTDFGALTILDAKTGKRQGELKLHAPKGRVATQVWNLLVDDESLSAVHRTVTTESKVEISDAYYGGDLMLLTLSTFQLKPFWLGKRPEGAMSFRGGTERPLGPITGANVAARVGDAIFVGAPGTKQVVRFEKHRAMVGVAVEGGAIALAGRGATDLYAVTYDRNVSKIHHRANGTGLSSAFAQLAPSTENEKTWLGRALFHSYGSLTSANGMACASCHPECRDDGLSWTFGEKTRNTPSLAGRMIDTAPFNWEGSEKTLEQNIAKTIKRMGGGGLDKKQLGALANYIRRVAPAPSNPFRTKEAAKDVALVRKGKAVFSSEAAGCAGCHLPDDGFTDGLGHDVVAGVAEGEQGRRYDTPSLRDVALTAPYLHDGSAETIEDVLSQTAKTMGKSSHLRKEERLALIAYLKTL